MEGFDRLRIAIVIRAMRDYYDAIKKKDTSTIKEIERWFLDENGRGIGLWFNIDGRQILRFMKRIDVQQAITRIKAVEHDYEKELKELAKKSNSIMETC